MAPSNIALGHSCATRATSIWKRLQTASPRLSTKASRSPRRESLSTRRRRDSRMLPSDSRLWPPPLPSGGPGPDGGPPSSVSRGDGICVAARRMEIAPLGDDFIFTCMPTSHKALYDFVDGAEFRRHEEKVRPRNTKETFRYRGIGAFPLRDGKDAMLVNRIGFEILDAKGKVKYSMASVTGLPVSKADVAEIVACGRARWKIENESFNVQKK